MYCIKCGKTIKKSVYNSKKYCSKKCCKLFLKAEYRKRNRKKINEYNRKYRRLGMRISGQYYEKNIKPKHLKKQPNCQKCGTQIDIQVCHVKPRNKGGNHFSLITLCRKHHNELDDLLRLFWV